MILYGIRNCDSVKKAKKFLEIHHISYAFHDFREKGLTQDKIDDWLSKVEADILLNKRSTTWKNLSETEKELPITQLLYQNPTLVKRPVLENGDKITIGFNSKEYEKLVPLFK